MINLNYISRFTLYPAVNTLWLHYKHQPDETHKDTVCAECKFLNVKPDGK
jgi:hypothetical protein